MGSPNGFSTMRDYLDTLVAFLFFSGGGPLMTKMEVPQAPWLPRREWLWSPWTTLILISLWRSSRSIWPSRRWFFRFPWWLRISRLPRQLFMWYTGSTLDQSIANMNRSVMHLLTAQWAANAQLQLQKQQNQAVQIADKNALKSLAESTAEEFWSHICKYTNLWYN